jgi:methanogenic corrinoid protein MtbC1
MTTFMDQVSGGSDQAARAGAARGADSAPGAADSGPLAFMPRHRRVALLARVVQSEILPRLVVARGAPATAETERVTTEDDMVALVSLLLNKPATEAIAFVDTLRERGISAAALYLGIVTQAARRLGELWEQDRCGFAEVTIGMGHLQQVVRALSPNFQVSALARPHADTALLLPAPGDQHTFGLVMLSEFFRREGWHVLGGPASTGNDAAKISRDTWIDVAGFSIGSENLMDALAAGIIALRRASRNRDIAVMVGGPLIFSTPDLVKRVGADTGAVDAPGAVREARALLSFRAAAD